MKACNICRIPIGILVPILVSLELIFRSVSGEHSHICFRPPGDRDNWPDLQGLGVDRFPSTDYFWGKWKSGGDEASFKAPDHKDLDLRLSLRGIYTDTTRLNGWFQLQVEYYEKQFPDYNLRQGIKMFVLWIENSLQEVIGEWVTDIDFPPRHRGIPKSDYTDCQTNALTRYMQIPCGGAYPTQPIVSNVALFVRNQSGENGFPNRKFVGPAVPYGDSKSLYFYFRITSIACSVIQELSIKGLVVADRHETIFPILWKAKMVENAVTGAPDVVPTDPRVYLDCTHGNEIKGTSVRDPHVPYYMERTINRSANPLEHLAKVGRGRGCQANLFNGRCPYNNDNIEELTGGAPDLSKHQNQASPLLTPKCGTPWQMGNLEYAYPYTRRYLDQYFQPQPLPYKSHYYKDYLDILRKEKCEAETCVYLPPILKDLSNLATGNALSSNIAVHESDGMIYDDQKGLHITGQFLVLWNLRKGHGCANVIVTLLLVPVSVFISRYFKETFMRNRVFFVRAWYQMHTHSTGWISAFTVAGAVVAYASRQCFGPSLALAALIHRVLGYCSYFSLVLLILGGGIRSINTGTRKCMIFCHWFWGLAFYALNIACIITAVGIPGSPVASKDLSEFPEPGILSQTSVIAVIVWIVIDILLHVVMSCLMKMNDLNMEVQRPRIYCPPPIPIVRQDEVMDAEGGTFRKFTLTIYIVVAVFFTFFICGQIYSSDHNGRGFGRMYCTHDEKGGFSYLPNVKEECT